jgi:hypothetical protein
VVAPPVVAAAPLTVSVAVGRAPGLHPQGSTLAVGSHPLMRARMLPPNAPPPSVVRMPRRAAKLVNVEGGRTLLLDPTGLGTPSQPVNFVFVDTTGDGKTDALIADTDGDGIGDAIVLDTTGDHLPDTAVAGVLVDTTGDGQANVLLVDTTEDGRADTLVRVWRVGESGVIVPPPASGLQRVCAHTGRVDNASPGSLHAAQLLGELSDGRGATRMEGASPIVIAQPAGPPPMGGFTFPAGGFMQHAPPPNGRGPRGDGASKHGWTREEDETIVHMVQTTGQKWSRIASVLPGRSDDAVRNRFLRLQKKKPVDKGPKSTFTSEDLAECETTKKGDMWTVEEDAKIIEGVRMHGLKWQLISPELPGRSANAVRNRYVRLAPAGEQPESPTLGMTGAPAEMAQLAHQQAQLAAAHQVQQQQLQLQHAHQAQLMQQQQVALAAAHAQQQAQMQHLHGSPRAAMPSRAGVPAGMVATSDPAALPAPFSLTSDALGGPGGESVLPPADSNQFLLDDLYGEALIGVIDDSPFGDMRHA